MKPPLGIRSLPIVAAKNEKIQATLLFSPEGVDYGNRYDTYDVTLTPDNTGTAIILCEMLLDVEGGAIWVEVTGNINVDDQQFYISSGMARLGVESMRGNLPHYCREHQVSMHYENRTPYEVDLTITIPALIVSIDIMHALIAEKLGR